MGLYVSIDPSHPTTSTNRPATRSYLDQRTLAAVQGVLADNESTERIASEIGNARFVSVGGAQLPKDSKTSSIAAGDQVLHVNYSDDEPTVFAQQSVDFTLGDTRSAAVRDTLAETLWDATSVDIIWFSTTPVVELEAPISTVGGWEQLNTVEKWVEEAPEYEMPLLGEVPDEELGEGRIEDLLQQLGGWPTAEGAATDMEAFILRTGVDEYEDEPDREYHYRENIPRSRQLREAAGNAQVVYLKDGRLYATGLLGDFESEEVDGTTYYSSRICGYKSFEPVELAEVASALSVSFPKRYGIIKISTDDLATILQASEPKAEGPEYESIGTAFADITNRLQDAGREDWLSEQPADVVIGDWTEALEYVAPGAAIPWEETAKLRQLIDLFEEYRFSLKALAAEIEAGALPGATASETLFIILIRDLQQRSGHEPNFTVEKLRVIREERYSTEFPSESETSARPVQHIEPPEKPNDAETIERQLQKTKQVIFYGPPGTGKTYQAQQFAKWWVAQQDAVHATTDQVRTVTFHPSYAYEDFVEGLTATTDAGGNVSYEIDAGIFREICRDATEAYEEAATVGTAPRYVLIVDEINRGDISQILGELITLLEVDKRLGAPNETTVELVHSGVSFTIPPNLYLIGTMNTADRSIALVDAAIRRRFRFLSARPDYELLLEHYGFPTDISEALETLSPDTNLETALKILSVGALQKINERILSVPDMEKGQQIGHTFLLELYDAEEIADAWRFEILPLLEEHYFSQFQRLRDEIFIEGGDNLFDWEQEEIEEFTPEPLAEDLMQVVDVDLGQDMRPDFEG